MDIIKSNIEERIIPLLDKAGMYYRIFSRAKSKESIEKKLLAKGDVYRRENRKMQDIIGLRIVFYFQDDVLMFYNKLKTFYGYHRSNESSSKNDLSELTDILSNCDDSTSMNKKLKKLLPFDDKIFMPERLNLVMEMNDQEKQMLDIHFSRRDIAYDKDLIDYTYEIQLRTVLSEGWHEVEHDIRYKTQSEPWWNFCSEESRMLNGIYASLETSETSLSRLIDELAYKNFKNNSWDAMIRFHFRRRTLEKKLDPELCQILDQDPRIAKQILHIERADLVSFLWNLNSKVPISTDFILFLVNRLVIRNEQIHALESSAISAILDNYQS